MKKGVAVLVVLVLAVAGGYFAASKIWGFPLFGISREEKPGEVSMVIVSMGQFVTNLADAGRYVRLTLDLEVRANKAAEISARASEIKTEINALLRGKTYDELSGETGLRNLQKEVLARLDKMYPGVIRAVFFAEFMIQ